MFWKKTIKQDWTARVQPRSRIVRDARVPPARSPPARHRAAAAGRARRTTGPGPAGSARRPPRRGGPGRRRALK